MKKTEKPNENFSPYVGLIPFSEKDAAYFFGRDSDGEIIATNLRATALTVFYGASGVGKSSLLNARVIPYLKKIAVSSNLPDEPPEFILVVLREWANNPLESLRLRLKEAVAETVKKVKIPKPNLQSPEAQIAQKTIEYLDEKDVEQTANVLKNNHDICDLLKNWADLTGTIFLIIFDQFEDIFLHPEFLAGENSFGDEFAKTLNCKDLPANFMISMRDDALAKMDIFKGKVPNMMKNILRLLHLDRAATEIAIRAPLIEYNKEFGTNFTIEKELVETLLNDLQVDKIKFETQGQADCAPEKTSIDNAYRVETPYLQLVMKRLWENPLTQESQKLQLSTLIGTETDQLGGVQNIVETHLDKVMEQFSEDEKHLAAKFIHFTVTRGGTKIPSDVNDLADWAELTDDKKSNIEKIRNILDKLCEGENRIFKKVNNRKDSKNPYYEVSHDALGPAIISWRKRQNESRLKTENDRKMQAEVEKAVKEKEEQEQKLQEEQSSRLMQEHLLVLQKRYNFLGKVIWGASIVFLIGAVGIYYYWWVWSYKDYIKKAEDDQKRYANLYDSQLNEYKSLINILFNLQSNEPSKITSALDNLQKETENNDLPDEYKDEITKVLNKIENKTEDEKEKEKIKTIIKNPQLQTKAQKSVENVLIFVQYANDNQETAVNQWRIFLKGSGYIAPPLDKVGDKAPPQNELRYFRKRDEKQATSIIQLLGSKGLKVDAKLISGYEDSPLIKENQFELWFNENIPNAPVTAK